MVLVKSPNFLILDEPTNDLDIVTLNTLEEFLDNFPGCLVIVSHDRYFMDRLVDHLFVFEGAGNIKDFPGNYSDFREALNEKQSIQKKEPISPASQPTPTSEKNADKASFKEKKEFEEIGHELEKLAMEKEMLVSKINKGSEDHEDLIAWSNSIEQLTSMMELLEMRWLELSELDGIE